MSYDDGMDLSLSESDSSDGQSVSLQQSENSQSQGPANDDQDSDSDDDHENLQLLRPKPKVKNPEKTFYFRLDKITAMFESKVSKFFIEFDIGGIADTQQTDEAIDVEVTKKSKDKDGNAVEHKVMIPIYKNVVVVYKEPAKLFYTR